MRRTPAVLAVLMMCALGACGDKESSDGASGSGSKDATTSAPTSGTGAAEATDFCQELSADEVGAILGGTVTAKEVPGGGCGFDQDDPRAPSIGLLGVVGAGGGFDASKQGNVTDGDVEDVSGVGDDAWIAIGRTGGDNQQGQGVVAVGDQLINVTLLQGNGLDAAKVKELTVKIMTLAASKA